ncbi:HlyD family secretion protein [Bordetella genomosp. 13]|uniref:HlyD family secretion protein n=1 Tax=Bordetella genomosp. 13 TaxID=463040 RepID=UPI00119F71C6|nr:HlyD family secretion protein [Bordetella genomosp. 13]
MSTETPRNPSDSSARHDERGDGRPAGQADREETHDEARDAKTGDDGTVGGKDAPRKRPGKKPLFILIGVVLVIVLVAVVWWFLTRNQESTDDAYTEGDTVSMAAQVGGYVQDLQVRDNAFVHKGDLLLRIDPRDYTTRRDSARAQEGLAAAQYEQAKVQLALAQTQYPAQLEQARAQEAQAQAALKRAQQSYQRQRRVDVRATTQESIDAADAQLRDARAAVQSAQAQVRIASQSQLQIDQARTVVEQRARQLDQARAQTAQAELDLSRTELRAPGDGWVTRRNVQLGSFVQPGSALFTLVTPGRWILANFKESQLGRMNPGDTVEIAIDAYPDLELTGHVESIQQGSGSRFSAFPAENATGNFVKIVQRVPVKIVIDHGLDPGQALPLGLSVVPTVTVE